MPNVLNDLIPDFYAALDVVSRELVGFLPSVMLDTELSRAAVGQDMTIPIAPAAAAEDVTPGTTAPDTGDQTIGNVKVTITKARAVPFRWTGEEQRGLNNGGPGYLTIRQSQIAQALRTLVNEIEADLALEYIYASRAFGTAGTTPFGTSDKSIDDIADVKKILKDNGAPMGDLSLVMDTTAGTNLMKVPNLYRVNESGDQAFLRQGVFSSLFGVDMRESAQVALHAPGTANAAYDTNGTFSVGDETVSVDTGSGTILAGDVVSFAGDSEKYVVNSALAGGDIGIAKPGLRAALGDGVDVTVAGAYRANMLFSRSAFVAAVRAPALPQEGDAAMDRIVVQDPRSGLIFEISIYPQHRRVRYEVAAAWGRRLIKSEHAALLLG